MKKTAKIEIALLIIILVFALIIRLYSLSNSPLWIDESISAIAGQKIIEKGVPIFDSGALYGRAYLFHYIEAFSMLLFGMNDFAVRFPSIIFGLLTILLAYFIGREYSKSAGLICALFTAIFYLEVIYSRQARFYQLFQLAFFASIYFLYKSKQNKNWIYLALISLIITIDTQIAGIILAPLFIVFILYNKTLTKKQKYLVIIPIIILVYELSSIFAIPMGNASTGSTYVEKYSSFARNMYYMLILAIPGIIWAFKKKKMLTSSIVIPALILLTGIFFIKMFAIRYAYFFIFPIILYSSLLMVFLYEKYGKLMIISILLLILFPSNLFFPHTYATIIKPEDYSYKDYSAPEINYKDIPSNLVNQIRTSKIFTLFSPGVSWYIKTPDYVFPFSMNGIGNDSISYNRKDVYSGAKISMQRPNEDFYFIQDNYSRAKLKPFQVENLKKVLEGCEEVYKNSDLIVYNCRSN